MEDNEKKILINVEDDETRIAVVDNATLDNLYIEQTHRTQILGNIYFGKVVKIQPSFQAAFVDYGADRHGFLAISDINSQLFKPNRATRGRPSINQLLKTGQQIMVQVIKDEVGHKGATLSTNISLPGRFLVFMPDSERGGVSRKIEDEEQRARLKHLLKGLGSEDASAIIRTAGVDRSLSELKRDFMNLRRIWNQIKQKFEEFEKPGLIYQEEEATTRMIRDYFTEDVGQVIIDDANAFQRTLEFFQANMPSQQNRLQLYLGEKTLFASYGIEAQVECLYRNHVPLPSGGSLVIVPTEALVAIDVNSGRSTKGKNIEETALGTNLEAAEEAARQLRLRNLGGLIVIDFIDMDLVKNRRAVEEKLADALKTDKARCTLGEISQFGLLELSRQRIAGSISRNSPELTMANLILRKIQDLAFEQKVSEIFMKLPIKLATHLLNVKRRQLSQLEMDYELRVEIKPDPTLELEELPEMEVVHKTTHGEMRSSIPIHAAELYEEGKNKSSRKRGRKKKQTEEETPEVVAEESASEEELEEWNAEDEKNGKYPSRKQRKRNKYMLKPDRSSWVPGADELAKGGLTKGYVGMSEAKKKKERKKQCHAYNPFHGKDGEFVNPESEAGSYSMKKPNSNSPDDCTWGQARRSSPNRSTQSTKRDCGRKGPYVCKDGRKKYEEKLLQLEKIIDPDLNEGNQEQLEAYLSGVISRELERAIQKHMNKQGCSFNQLVRALYAWNSAEKGKDTSSKN